MSSMEIQQVMSPEFQELETRYQSIIKDIYAKAAREMQGVPVRTQSAIHRNAIETAWPFIEEIGRIRSFSTSIVVLHSPTDEREDRSR